MKTAKVIKPYTTKIKGVDFTIPIGATVSNQTATGPDDNYRFWADFRKFIKDEFVLHELTYYGINIPAEYCKPYPKRGVK